MVRWWLEFDASQPGAYEKANERFWRPLGVERRIIRKGHPEDNPFVERSHQTDDYEFYIPHLIKIKSEEDFIRLRRIVLIFYNKNYLMR
ncbi:MAG: hypothetical protein ABIK99_01755 [candidate division WOR-3 bacterium]